MAIDQASVSIRTEKFDADIVLTDNASVSVRTEKFEADIVLTDDGKWSLNWGDYVINETIEVYSDLALALIRLGTLVRAVDTETMFAHTNAEDFTRAANKWLTDSALEGGLLSHDCIRRR